MATERIWKLYGTFHLLFPPNFFKFDRKSRSLQFWMYFSYILYGVFLSSVLSSYLAKQFVLQEIGESKMLTVFNLLVSSCFGGIVLVCIYTSLTLRFLVAFKTLSIVRKVYRELIIYKKMYQQLIDFKTLGIILSKQESSSPEFIRKPNDSN